MKLSSDSSPRRKLTALNIWPGALVLSQLIAHLSRPWAADLNIVYMNFKGSWQDGIGALQL